MKKLALGLLTLTVALLSGTLTAPSAHAEVYGGSISAPSTVDAGWEGNVDIVLELDDWEGDGEVINVVVQRFETGAITSDQTYDVTGRTELSVPVTLARPGEYTISVTDARYGSYVDEVWITARPLLELTVGDARPAAFYPLVRDGFKDTVSVPYVLSRRAQVSVKVTNAAGRVVERDSFTAQAGRRRWTWRGTTEDGRTLREGRHVVTLTATAGDRTRSGRTRVDVVTDTVRQTVRLSRYGRQTARRYGTGDCDANVYSYSNELSLDCWDFFGTGDRAFASWAFRVPASATRVRWAVVGREGCCDDGRIARSARHRGDRLVVQMLVTGSRAFTVRRVDVSYSVLRTR